MPDPDYEEELPARLRDRNRWPDFDRPDFLSELDGLAEEAMARGTPDGYLAAILIYSQLADEILRLLLADVAFFIQLHLFPHEIHFPPPERATFGELIRSLERTMSFDGKPEILADCRTLNTVRNDLVHKLTRHASVQDLAAPVELASEVFRQLMTRFLTVHDWFALVFKDFRKDEDWYERAGGDEE